MEDENRPAEDGTKGRKHIKGMDRDTGESWMMDCGDHCCPCEPHGAEELMPERCAIEDEHLPEQESPGPDGHGEWRQETTVDLPVKILLFYLVE